MTAKRVVALLVVAGAALGEVEMAGARLAETPAAGEPATRHDPPLLEPDTSAMAEPVRRGLAQHRARVEVLAASATTAADRAVLAAAYGQLGQLYHAHGLTEAALAAYGNARRLDPGAHRWAYYQGALLHAGGDLAAAEGALASALEAVPDDAPTVLRLGQVLLAARRLDEAERAFRRALEIDEESAAAWFGLGQVAAERRDPGRAIAAFERVLELQPEASIAHYPLALAYRDRGDAERARGHLARRGETAVRSPDPLLRELTTLGKISALEVVLADAGDAAVPARDLIGFAIGQLHDVDDAVQYLKASIDGDGSRPGRSMTPFGRARVHAVVGALLVERGDVAAAERELEAALAVAPDLAEAGVRLGNLLGRERRFEDAIARYGAVLEREAENAEALLGRADALASLGRDDEALEDLARLETITPGQGRIALRAAAALERLGRMPEALARYREAATRAATDEQAAAAQAGIGRLLATQGSLEEAREAFATAARLDPARQDVHLGLASASARLGRFAEAAASYRVAIELDAESAEARIGEASALLLAARWVEARSRLEGAARVLPENATLRHLLARLLAACPDRALRDGRRAVALARELWRDDPSDALAETLAMALAEGGLFGEASAVQAALVTKAAGGERGAAGAKGRLEANLARYQRGEACCDQADPGLLLP